MALVDSASLPEVIDAGAVSALGDQLTAIGNAVVTAVSEAHGAWGALRDVFDVTGAEGVFSMLDRPQVDATDFSRALSDARNVMWDAASLTLPGLKTRRDELAARIAAVNATYDEADTAWQEADAAYWTQWRADRDSEATATAKTARTRAASARSDASDAGDVLRDDIESFRRDVESAEETIASQLNNIAGGTEVHGAWGEPVRISQSYWGYVDAPYPGAPSAATTRLTLAQRLAAELSDSVASRIDWLGSADPDDVTAWVAAHPDFASAVGLVDPERAARLWQSLAAESVPLTADTPGWAAGPLAQLLALAPVAVGNLNGIPAEQRNLFNRTSLQQLLGDDSLDGDVRSELENVLDALNGQDGMPAALLSLYLDTNGEPRAAVAYGDVENSDLLVSVTHGIANDVEQLQPWAQTTRELRTAIAEEAARRGLTPGEGRQTVATIAYFGWDSGDQTSVFDTHLASSGAPGYSNLMLGLEARNPSATRAGWFHSYGTTMAGETLVADPTVLDAAFFFGSAGISPAAADELPRLAEEGTVEVFATHAEKDWTAPLGRSLWSTHRTNPSDILDADHVLGADGGVVDFGPGADGTARTENGLPTDGHASHTGNPWYEWTGTQTGYLDPRAQSYLGGVDGLADLLQERR
jgi:hypothetical protein